MICNGYELRARYGERTDMGQNKQGVHKVSKRASYLR